MSRSTTPILDLEAALPVSRDAVTFRGLLKALPAAIGLIALVPATMFLTFGLGRSVPPWLTEIFVPVLQGLDRLFQNEPFVAIALFWLAMFLVLAVHEAGHAVVALVNRWPIAEFRVFPFSTRRTKEGWKVIVSWKLWPGGLVVANPPTAARFHSRIRIYALGGPMLNLAAGILVLLMPFTSSGSAVSAFPVIFVIWSFITGLFNLLPLHIRGLELDGYVALIVSRNPQHLSMRLAAFKMLAHVLRGKPLDSMNRRWVALAEASRRVSRQNRVGAWLAYTYWSQRQQFDRAALMLERMLQTSGDVDEPFKALLFAECSVFTALRGQSVTAQTWKKRASEFFLPEYLRRRCNSYAAWVEHDFEAAYDEAILARDAALKLGDKTQKSFLPSWNKWIEALDKSRTLATKASNEHRKMVFPYT